MVNGLIGRKVGMSQVFDEEGRAIPVTLIQAGPCVVVQVKANDRDRYEAVQLGLVEKVNPKRITKPLKGHLEKAGAGSVRVLKEFKRSGDEDVQPGQQVTVDIFEGVDKVNVTGKSKGKGFQGVMKRHGFAGGPGGHGSNFHRAPGGIGQCAWPARVFPGKKMPGQMGNKKVSVRGLRVVSIDKENNLLVVKGAVPGSRGSYVFINKG
ncbi:MAG: 50S ribosomal protein L3 [Acidobacteria bacterium]|nr:MAG: 50S ribosomal protein L3 [Acidobacteriota bacterium]